MATSRSKSKIMRDHEMNLALINAFARDPELKYYVGMAMGAGVAWVGAMMGQAGTAGGPAAPGQWDWQNGVYTAGGEITTPPGEDPITELPFGWLFQPGGKYSGQWFAEKATGIDFTGGLQGNFGNILMLGGTGFAGTCAMILILKAIFSGTDLGELLTGVGEIIPG